MANTDKDILITPNVGETDEPKIEFIGFDNNPITLKVADDNALSFSASLGQILTLDTNTTSGDSLVGNDISGIPVIAAGLDGTAKLNPFGGKTAVGGTSAIARLHIHQDTFNPNSPTLAFPDSVNPRYSAGFSSANVSGIGQRLDVYAGDSGTNTSNLGSNAVVMSVRADKRVGIKTTSPNSPLDIVTLDNGTNVNQPEQGPELRSSNGEYRWRFTTNTDATYWYFKWKVPSNTSGSTHDALWMRSRSDKIGPEQWRFRAYGRNYDSSTEQLRDIFYLDSYRAAINLTGSFDGYAKLDVNGATRLRSNVGIMNWGPSTSDMIRAYWEMDFRNSGWSLMYILGYYNNRQMHSWRTQFVNRTVAYYRNWSRYFEATSGSTQGGRPIYYTNIESVTTGQGVNTGDSRVVAQQVLKQYGPLGANYAEDGYRIVSITIPNYNRTYTETLDVDGNPTGNFVWNNVGVDCTLTIESTTANSMTGAAEGHKFMYNQGLTFTSTGLGTAAGGTNGNILDTNGSQSGTFNRNNTCYRPNSSDTNPYPTTILIRVNNPGWEQLTTFGGGTPPSTGTYNFAGNVPGGTANTTYVFTCPSTARVKGQWVRLGLFNTGTGANTALDVGWNDRFTMYFLPPQGQTLPYSTTVPANGAGATERGRSLYVDTTRSASYNISNSGQIGVYSDFSMSWQNYGAIMYGANGDQQDMFLDSWYPNLTYAYARHGNVDKRNYANAYIGYSEGIRSLSYNLYGGRWVNMYGFKNYNRNYRNGYVDNMYAFNSDQYNGLNANTSGAGYVANMIGWYNYQDTRYSSRTNWKCGIYTYNRVGVDAEERVRGTTVNASYGAYLYTRMDGGNCYNMRGIYVNFDIRGIHFAVGGVDSAGNNPVNLSYRYGIYCRNEDQNYFSGRVGIGTNPASGINLDVTGEMRVPTITTNTIRFRQTGYGTNSDPYGFRFVTPSSNVSRLELHLNDDSNEEFAIYGYSCSGYSCGEWSGNKYHYFRSNGDAFHSGTLTKGSGTFRIPHPLPELTETKDLVHSFVEGPRPDLIYRDKVALVNGTAIVDIDVAVGMTPGTWELLCRDPQVFVVNNQGWTPVRATVTESGIVTIEAQDLTCTDTIDWMVIAERQDAKIREANWTDDDGRTILEPDKMRPEDDYPDYESFLAEEPENKSHMFDGQVPPSPDIDDPDD
jgi:hypothetical protein